MVSEVQKKPTYAEFFSGGGMVRAALSDGWDCRLANDIDPMKCEVYARNWGDAGLVQADVGQLDPDLLRQPIDMYWASSPCQDFSLAGKGLGLAGSRSGTFSTWATLIEHAIQDGYAPRIIAFENVVGLIARNRGADFAAVIRRLAKLGYRVGALEIDATAFLPQSRSRLFVVCLRDDLLIKGLTTPQPTGPFHTRKLMSFVASAPRDIARNWMWWKHAPVASDPKLLVQMIDHAPDTAWLTARETKRLLSMMSPPSLSRIETAKRTGHPEIGMLYKRGRPDGNGSTHQRAEVRFDGIAGCLRTPGGGSSRQTVLFVEGDKIRARLLSSREAARLMGLEDSYVMPARYNNAYKVAGDGVVVPVVRYLDQQIFQPALQLARLRDVA
ncbi:DNA cytosine methyltransferase [Sulfitobacter sp. SK011]|uniref:DNA cytosine methyltransferase n=1 Tax=Sulfitobacter sp. SK011 TaxID=1389004 RepID=UPI000E0C4027|nr:DNA cytosine methyltransferase [Sulfitobacter sp. SK011]AXI42246.1 DNA (cytosine-5-)-methyltransferase [Sulfitobacter sp. SK011]